MVSSSQKTMRKDAPQCWRSNMILKQIAWLCTSTLFNAIQHFSVLSSFTTYHRFVTRLTRGMQLVEQELFTFLGHLSSPPGFSCMCMFCRSLFVLMSFFFWPLCFLSFSIYGFWLPIWYLQTLFTHICFLANCLLEFVFVQCGFDQGENRRAFP
jgi:hypothetical protein